MASKVSRLVSAQLGRIFPLLLGLPWTDIVRNGQKLARGLQRSMEHEGLYEVLDYESKLELLDTKGKRARFSKRERVRYLQNNIIAYQDHAWGDGRILLNYRCTPGEVVDRYQLGHRIFLLISLRESKRKGERDEFNMQWRMLDNFLSNHESWETEIRHKTRMAQIQIVFPRSRTPQRLWLEEYTRRKRSQITKDELRQIPEGGYQFTWQLKNPRLHERYQIHWTW
jgi:hypothetical protein